MYLNHTQLDHLLPRPTASQVFSVNRFAASDADKPTSFPSTEMWPYLPHLAAHLTMMQCLNKYKTFMQSLFVNCDAFHCNHATSAFSIMAETTKYQQATCWQA